MAMVAEIGGRIDTKPVFGTVPGKSRVPSEMVNQVRVHFISFFVGD